MSLDDFVAGPSQDEEDPLGVGGVQLHEWAFPLGGATNASSSVVRERHANIGAAIMGPQHVRHG